VEQTPMNVRKVVGIGFMLLVAAGFAACGGGSVSVPPSPVATASPTPVPIPSSSPFSVTQQQLGVPIATAPPSGATPSPVPVPLANANGIAAMLDMPPANSAGTESITATVQNTAPTSVPVLDLKRAAQALRRTQQTIPAVAVVYLGLYWGSPITFLATPGFSIAVPAADIVPNTSYYLAMYDPTRPSLGWQYGFEGPATVVGTTLNFTGSTSAFSFAADVQYWLAVIALPQSVSPTPAPSVAPTSVPTTTPPPPSSPGAGLTMTFDDEFNGAAGTPVNTANWTDDTGPWSQNQELEYYANVTNSSAPNYAPQYAEQDGNGHLVITANSGNPFSATCSYGPCQYVSARLTTRGIFSQTYGYFEARIQIPPGQGLWPAFWLTDGTNATSGGEIDAMETIGSSPATVFGALHGPGFNTTGPLTVEFTEPSGVPLSSGFHVYGVLWSATSIQYYLDNALYATVTPSTIPAGGTWVFNQPFYLVLNLAVGGDFPGSPNGSTPFPATMIVDYVHGYQ
jgi:beta-glucanase (GH16 family)